MRRRVIVAVLVATSIVAAAVPAVADRYSGRVEIEGTVIGLAPWDNTFTVRVDRRGFGVVAVWVQSFTRFEFDRRRGDDDRRGGVRNLRVGDSVEVEGLRLDDGRVLALNVEVKDWRREGRRDAPVGLITSGLVTMRGPSLITVLQRDGSSRQVILTSETRVSGQRDSIASLSTYDIVRVQGVPDNGGLVARQIEVTFAATASVAGVVTAKTTQPAILVLNGLVAVGVAGDTFVVSGGRVRSFAEIPLGRMVTAWGMPATSVGVGGSFRARVIVF
jgi:hypothetical protein